MNAALLRIAAVLTLAWLAACGRTIRSDVLPEAAADNGGNESAGGSAGAGVSVLEALPGTFLDALCTYYMSCAGSEQFRDREHCQAELDPYGVPALVEALAAGHVAIDEAALERCFIDFRANPCEPPRVVVTLGNDQLDIYQFLKACPGVLEPLQGLGDPCKADDECDARLRCDTSTCPGSCIPRYQAGEPCDVPLQMCAVPFGICQGGICHVLVRESGACLEDLDCWGDLLCDPETRVCVPPERPGLGGRCFRHFNGGKPALECQPGLYCADGGDVGAPGVCQALRGKGEPCDYHGCEPDLVCAALGGGERVCHGKAPEGGLCDYTDVTRTCQAGLVCRGNDDPPPTGVCEPAPKLGEPCLFPCAAGLTCDMGYCVRSAFPGDPCDQADDVCQGSRCVDGVCRLHAGVGEPCSDAEDCLARSCRNGVCADRTACTP